MLYCPYFIFFHKALLGVGGWFLLVVLCPEVKVSTEVGFLRLRLSLCSLNLLSLDWELVLLC